MDILSITLENDLNFYYENDIAEILFNIPAKSEFPLTKIKKYISDNDLELKDYTQIVHEYFKIITKQILNSVPIEWKTFKNYLTCSTIYDNIKYNISVNTFNEYKPDETFEYAIDKYNHLHSSSNIKLEWKYIGVKEKTINMILHN